MLLQILTLLGALGLFLYGMSMLSKSLQKLYGDRLRKYISWMTGTRLRQVAAGFIFTVAVLFSRATTLMVVSSTEAGILSLAQAVGVIMGANIGTTVTAWIITIFGFSLNIWKICYPLMFAGFVCTMLKRFPKVRTAGEIIIGIILVFIGLHFTQTTMEILGASQGLSGLLSGWASHGYGSVLIYFATGVILAFVLRSSSAVVAVSLILTAMGWIPFHLGAALVLGANLGAPLNLTLAARKGNTAARRAAAIHLIFKAICVVVALALFYPFVHLTGWIISLFGPADPSKAVFVAGTPLSSYSALYGIALFHTLLSLLGTLILIWWPGLFEKAACALVADEVKTPDSHLKYITGGPLGTPAISIVQAFKEAANFGEICEEELTAIREAIGEEDPDKFEDIRMKLVQYEEITDRMELEIASFLGELGASALGVREAGEVKSLYRIISELESFGDSGENISRILDRERAHGRKFDPDMTSKLFALLSRVESACSVMVFNLGAVAAGKLDNIENAYLAENEVNSMRDSLREWAISSIEDTTGGNYQSVGYFLDIIAELEAMGDFLVNISESAIKATRQ